MKKKHVRRYHYGIPQRLVLCILPFLDRRICRARGFTRISLVALRNNLIIEFFPNLPRGKVWEVNPKPTNGQMKHGYEIPE